MSYANATLAPDEHWRHSRYVAKGSIPILFSIPFSVAEWLKPLRMTLGRNGPLLVARLSRKKLEALCDPQQCIRTNELENET
jgi:hypothetical protein